ncbi:hypothetical protein BX616_008057, partial [Lobosporangium transversale]
ARAARKEMQEEKLKEYEKYRRQLKIKYGEPLSDEEEDKSVFSGDEQEGNESGSDDEKVKGQKTKPKKSEFKTKTSLTTVTVIEDMNQDDGLFGLPKNNTATMEKNQKKKSKGSSASSGTNAKDNDNDDDDEGENDSDRKRRKIGSSSATTLKGANKIKNAKEKKKFRYEGKMQRKITAIKDRSRSNRSSGG